MKKIFLFMIIAMLAITANAQDFSAVCETGQTLYYKIKHKTNNQVEVVGPGYMSYYQNRRVMYPWEGFEKPKGKVVLPSHVEYNGVNYEVVSINMRAFEGCSEMTSITIPNTITDVDPVSFEKCRNLAEIRVLPGNPVYDSRDNCNAVIKTKENELVFGCKNTVIPKTVKSLGWYAFRGSGLTNITLPNTLEYISSDAFYNCWITSLIIPSSIQGIGTSPFDCDMVTASLTNTPLQLEVGKYYFEEYYDEDGYAMEALVVPCGMKKTYEQSPWGKYFVIWEHCDTYSIDVKNEAGGVVMLSTNKAKFGETVSVYYRTEQYSEDYYLIVCSKDSHRVMVPVRSNTFIMPPYDVTIEIFKR